MWEFILEVPLSHFCGIYSFLLPNQLFFCFVSWVHFLGNELLGNHLNHWKYFVFFEFAEFVFSQWLIRHVKLFHVLYGFASHLRCYHHTQTISVNGLPMNLVAFFGNDHIMGIMLMKQLILKEWRKCPSVSLHENIMLFSKKGCHNNTSIFTCTCTLKIACAATTPWGAVLVIMVRHR